MPRIPLALRTLARTPFVTAVAIGSLALGIGANTAIFSMFRRIILQPLPVPDAHELVNLEVPGPNPGSQSCNQAGSCEEILSYPMFRDLERGQTALAGFAGHRLQGANLSFRNQVHDAEMMLVSGGYFPVLQLRPALGRLLGPADDATIGAHFVAVLSHHYWESRLGRDPAVVGETMMVNGTPMTVVGVAPEGFEGTTLGSRPAVFLPLAMEAVLSQGSAASLEDRRDYWIYAFGRLQPGGTLAQAQDGLNALYAPIINDVEAPLQTGMSPQTLERFRAKRLVLTPGARGQTDIHREASAPMLMLFSVTAIVLLIACVNVANLLLARSAERSVEMAVRLSLGARRRQLLAQLLTEACVLALVAGGVSLLVANGTLGLIVSFLPAEAVETITFAIDGPALGFAAATSIGTGLVFGIVPALHGTRPELLSVIKGSSGSAGGGRSAGRFRAGLVTAQIALSMALLAISGLFIRSLVNVSRVELGLETGDVVVFRISPVRNGYDAGRSRALFQRVEEELAALPGVERVAASRVPVLAGSNWGTTVRVEGFEADPDTDTGSRYNQVGAGFLGTLGMQLLAGREFTAADDAGAPRVAIVNETFARKFNLGREAVGKRMAIGSGELEIEIVGLMKDAKYSEVKDQVPPVFFLPARQDTSIGAIGFNIRTRRGATIPVLRAVPQLIARLDPNLPVTDLLTLPEQVRENVFLDRMISVFATAFAVLATLLAAIGLYGVLAYSVAQRTREIGVRMALGADAGRVRAMVLRQVGWMTALGGVIGVAAAIGLGQAARSLLFEVQGYDPLALAGAAAVLGLVSLGAGYLPALRASRVQPMRALRYE